MCNKATMRISVATLVWASVLSAQTATEWRRVGNSAIDRSLAGLATGPVERVWYSPDGSRLGIRTGSGRVFETADFETWQPSSAAPPAEQVRMALASRLPENSARVRGQNATATTVYAFGRFAYRSE